MTERLGAEAAAAPGPARRGPCSRWKLPRSGAAGAAGAQGPQAGATADDGARRRTRKPRRRDRPTVFWRRVWTLAVAGLVVLLALVAFVAVLWLNKDGATPHAPWLGDCAPDCPGGGGFVKLNLEVILWLFMHCEDPIPVCHLVPQFVISPLKRVVIATPVSLRPRAPPCPALCKPFNRFFGQSSCCRDLTFKPLGAVNTHWSPTPPLGVLRLLPSPAFLQPGRAHAARPLQAPPPKCMRPEQLNRGSASGQEAVSAGAAAGSANPLASFGSGGTRRRWHGPGAGVRLPQSRMLLHGNKHVMPSQLRLWSGVWGGQVCWKAPRVTRGTAPNRLGSRPASGARCLL